MSDNHNWQIQVTGDAVFRCTICGVLRGGHVVGCRPRPVPDSPQAEDAGGDEPYPNLVPPRPLDIDSCPHDSFNAGYQHRCERCLNTRDYILGYQENKAQLAATRNALADCLDALEKLPPDVFGTASSDEGTNGYIRDELIGRGRSALDKARAVIGKG